MSAVAEKQHGSIQSQAQSFLEQLHTLETRLQSNISQHNQRDLLEVEAINTKVNAIAKKVLTLKSLQEKEQFNATIQACRVKVRSILTQHNTASLPAPEETLANVYIFRAQINSEIAIHFIFFSRIAHPPYFREVGMLIQISSLRNGMQIRTALEQQLPRIPDRSATSNTRTSSSHRGWDCLIM